jgi:hypothetical protein
MFPLLTGEKNMDRQDKHDEKHKVMRALRDLREWDLGWGLGECVWPA